MNKRCTCDREACRVCWLYANDQRYRTLWGGDRLKRRRRRSFQVAPKTTSRPADCIHLGAIQSRTNADGHECTCEGKWLRGCDKHGQCRVNEVWDGADCQSCGQYWSRTNPNEPPEFAATRHLLYFIFPLAGNGVWQRNVEQLLKRIDLFNGKRVIAVVTGNLRRPGMRPQILDSPDAVQAAFAGHGCELVVMPNNKALGEVVAWPTLWGKVLPGGHGDCTFYAHAKGVTRPRHSIVHRWVELMYATLLDDWPNVRDTLATNPVACAFKKLGYGFSGIASQWHPSGTYAWVRNADMAARKWQDVPQAWGGTEAIWGVLFKPEEAGCVLHEANCGEMNLYDPGYLSRVVEPAYAKWHARQRPAVPGV